MSQLKRMPEESSKQQTWLSRGLSYIVVALLAVIITGIALTWSRYTPARPINIIPASPSPPPATVYVGGMVVSPGFYPLQAGDTVSDIIRDAGGVSASASPGQISIYVDRQSQASQKVNINRAPAWLLQSLPGIAEVRAEAIISYRQQNDGFKNISELLKVDGISNAIYDRIKSLVTVAD